MNSSFWSPIVAALVATFGAAYATIITRRATRDVAVKQNRLEQRQIDLDKAKVDGAAYDRARAIDQQVLNSLRGELARTQQARINDAVDAQRRITELEKQTIVMRADLQILRKALRDEGLPIPTLSTPT